MRIHYLQHVAFEGLGYVEKWLRRNGATVSGTRFFEDARFPTADEIDGLIVLGGPMSVNDAHLHPWLGQEIRFIADMIACGKPVLGICLGVQLIAKAAGATVYKCERKEIGWFPIKRATSTRQTLVEKLLPEQAEVFHWHGETFDLPTGATRLASSSATANQAFLLGDRVLGFQFHLEVTREGVEMLTRHCASDLVPDAYVQQTDSLLRDDFHFHRLHSLLSPILDHLFLADNN